MARLIEVRTQEKSRADQALADTRRFLHIAQRQVEQAKAAAAEAATAAGDLQNEHKKKHAELCQATLRADHDRLVVELEELERQQRQANFAVAETAYALIEAEQREADLAAAADAATAAAADAAKDYDEASAQEELLASWRAALDADATRQAVTEGGTVKSNVPYTAAAARLSRLVGGDAMLEMYRQRAWFAAENVAQSPNRTLDAIRAAARARSESEPLASNRLAAAAEWAVWIDCIQDAAEATVTRLKSAQKVFTELAAPGDAGEDEEPLRSRLARIRERAGRATGDDAPAKERAYFESVRALHNAEAAYAREELVEVAEDPDADHSANADLSDEREALRLAQEAAAAAEADYNSVKGVLDDYEVAVPPEFLADVMAFLDAEMAIDLVAGQNAEEIRTRLAEAESSYAEAERVEVKERRAVAMVDSQVEGRRRRQTASAGVAAAHRLLTIRGDR